MRWIRPGKAIVFIVLLVTLGCRGGAQLYQVRDAPVQTATGHPASLDQIQKAIIDAGAGLGWIMAVAKPGEIVATLNLRSQPFMKTTMDGFSASTTPSAPALQQSANN